MGKGPNRHFSKEDIQGAQRHMKGCSASLVVREIKVKTPMRSHLTSVRLAIINKQQVLVRLWKKGNLSTLLVGMQTVENSMEFPQKN